MTTPPLSARTQPATTPATPPATIPATPPVRNTGGSSLGQGVLATAYTSTAGQAAVGRRDGVDRVTLTSGAGAVAAPVVAPKAGLAKPAARAGDAGTGKVIKPTAMQGRGEQGQTLLRPERAAGVSEAVSRVSRHTGPGGLIDVRG